MDPHAADYAGAVAGMAETYGYRPAPGDCVIAEPPYVGGRRAGIVRATNGTHCLVEMDGEMLVYYPHELEYAGQSHAA